MESADEIRKQIRAATTTEDRVVREAYLSKFTAETEQFIEGMSRAYEQWRKLDRNSHLNLQRAYTSAHAYSAISLHILSMNLFLSGKLVAAGNIQRQTLESIAMSLLLASSKLDVFERYEKGNYSTSKAPATLQKHYEKLGLVKAPVETLMESVKFYHNWSHANLMTIVTHIDGSSGNLYVGAAYDARLEEQYGVEARGRANLASVFDSMVIAARRILERGTARYEEV